MKKLLLLFAFFGASFFTPLFGQLDVKPGNQPPFTPENLVTNFMTSGGINVLNVTYNGDPQAVGYFTGADTLIGLERGLILTTGSAAGLTGSTVGADGTGSEFASFLNTGGTFEPHLSAVSTGPLYNIAYYTITFQSYNDSIRFRYVFASEEYPEYSCTAFNDIFGFFLEGPGYPSPVNIALIPGTNLPVSINNIHPDNPTFQCNAAFELYYNANDSSSNQPAYDGVLDPFVAEAAVEPCGIYTMTIAIADVSDAIYDSGVFLEANSFGSSPFVEASFGPGANVLPEGATGLPVSLTFSQIPANELPLTVSFGGDAGRDTDYSVADSTFTISSADSVLQFSIQPLTDTLPEVVETVVVTVTGANCFVKTFELYITDPGIIFKNADTLDLAGILTLGGEIISTDNTIFNFSNETDYAIDTVNTAFASSINVHGIPLEKLSDPAVIESVCININHTWIDDINVYLMAPGGQYMELTTSNGGNGDNYTGTCFSPSATQPIDYDMGFAPASAAPFTGLFQPEGKWTDLTDSEVNGSWKLLVLDDVAGFTGVLSDWSITFNTALAGNFNYAWSSGETTKTIDVDAPGFYTVTVSNDVATYSKTYFVKPTCGFSQQNYTLCHGESVVVNGIIYDENNSSGSQTFNVSPGCDSVLTVQVYFLPEQHQVINAASCNGEGYIFGNEVIYQSGTYEQSLTSTAGCDSLVTLHLTVNPTIETFLNVSICNGAAYQFGNETITASGTYTNMMQSVNGCDSTAILHLSVLPASSDSIFVVLTLGEVFEAGGMQFSEFGDFIVNLQAANGCDSTLFIHIDIVDGVNNPDLSQLVNISPNPAHQEVQIQYPRELYFSRLTVRSPDGRIMLNQNVSAGSSLTNFDVSNWQSGVYTVEISGPDGNFVRKLIKI